jgi:hypothetical protein
MRLLGGSSWQIRVDRWGQAHDLPLWVRAAERIGAAGALVPGPVEIDPVPVPSGAARDAGLSAELAEGWTAWWHAAVREPARDPAAAGFPAAELDGALLARPAMSLRPPDFDGLRPWPALREIAVRRWPQAHQWHSARKRAGVRVMAMAQPDNGRVVREVERSLGHRVRPFLLELIVLPVRDDEVRRVWEGRFLVPERVYDGPGWVDILQRMVVRLGG